METTRETILLVDDEPNVRSMIREVLELHGYHVIDAGDAAEAADVEARTPGPIHVLLTDVMMPGMSGPDLARRLRPRRPRMALIYMTAFSLADIEYQRIELEPGVPILAKPFGVELLIEQVRGVLAAPVPGLPSPFDRARR